MQTFSIQFGASRAAMRMPSKPHIKRVMSNATRVQRLAPTRMLVESRRPSRAFAAGPGASMGMSPELKASIDRLIAENKVVVFMKGTKQFPQCGFSNTVVQILNMLDVPFESVNILADDDLRSGMKEYSQWPTFPQVYINGEFFGGCDIMIQAYQSGELKEQLEIALNS